MIRPRVTFRISAKKDLETLRAFAKDAEYDDGRNLNWAVFDVYPQLRKEFNNKNTIINDKNLQHFIDEIYRARRIIMERSLAQQKKRWEKIAPIFFSLVDSLFDNRKWPRGKYIAFVTIWGMYPRFLEDKTFQIPFRHRKPQYIPVIIAHELLHFMFYDYFYSRYPQYNKSKYNFFVWHISEIFNTIVQNSPAWLKRFKLESLGYPEHKKIVARITRGLYQEVTWNLDVLVAEIVKSVSKEQIHVVG